LWKQQLKSRGAALRAGIESAGQQSWISISQARISRLQHNISRDEFDGKVRFEVTVKKSL
jgi:hypothetical protein